MQHGPPRRLAALLLLAALLGAGTQAAGDGQFLEGVELDAALRRRLLQLSVNGTLDCDQTPYMQQLTITTPGLYQFRIKAIGAHGTTTCAGCPGRGGGHSHWPPPPRAPP